MITIQCKKLPNCKTPVTERIQGYLAQKYTSLHKCITQPMEEIINSKEVIPAWMTNLRTVLCQKDLNKGNEVGNFRPISFLPFMRKLLTGVKSSRNWMIMKFCQINRKIVD